MDNFEVHYAGFVEKLFVNRSEGQDGIVHAAIGIAGEGGELLDAVKKMWAYNKPLDHKNVIEELGDLEFYMQAMRTRIGISREQCLQANIDKLKLRYPGGYTDFHAWERLDKRQA